jgi:hypothetical protein
MRIKRSLADRGTGASWVLGHQVWPLRKALHAEPVTLAIIKQEFEGGAGAVSKDIDGALDGILPQALMADGAESVDAFSEIDGFGG